MKTGSLYNRKLTTFLSIKPPVLHTVNSSYQAFALQPGVLEHFRVNRFDHDHFFISVLKLRKLVVCSCLRNQEVIFRMHLVQWRFPIAYRGIAV